MVTISIDGVIGWEITHKSIKEKLDSANGEDVTIEISSPGGFVYDGLAIFNAIRDYSRKYNVITKLIGFAASMASYIALAGNRVIAEDNAVFMIHNVWGLEIGDYRELRKTANELEKLTDLLANAYQKKSGKSKKEIRKLMDEETFFYGDESLNAGFVDEIIETEKEKDKSAMILIAKDKIKNCILDMKKIKKKDDLQKAVALIESELNSNQNNISLNKNKKIKNEENKIMTLEEIKNKFPELYNEIYNTGKQSVLDNIEAHSQWFDVAPSDVMDAIKKNEQFTPNHISKYSKAKLFKTEIQNRQTDDQDIGDILNIDDQMINGEEIALKSFENALN